MTDAHTRPDGRPKNTGQPLFGSIARVRVDDTPAPNDRVAIHIEHPDHDGGVRCFYRARELAAAAIRSHLQGLDVTCVDITDEVGLGLSERALLGERDVVAATGVEAEG